MLTFDENVLLSTQSNLDGFLEIFKLDFLNPIKDKRIEIGDYGILYYGDIA